MTEMMTGKWSDEEGEGRVVLSKKFFESHRVTQLDFLKDAIYELTEIYDEMLEIKNEL